MILCDEEGVPRIVQNVRFYWAARVFDVRLFNGGQVVVPIEHVTWNRRLIDYPDGEIYEEAAQYVERIFPTLRYKSGINYL